MDPEELSPVILSLPLPTPPNVSEKTVELLRYMLAKAEAGAFQDVAILTAGEDGTVGYAYNGDGTGRWANLLAATESFRHRLVEHGV